MADYIVQVTLKTTSGVAEDFVTNTFSINAVDAPALDDAVDAIWDLYEYMVLFFSDNIVQNGHQIKAYDRADTPPRAPVVDTVRNLPSAPTDDPLPHQLCAVLSFQGGRVSGIPQARRRGRIYFGPLGKTRCDSDGRLTAATVTALATAGDALMTAGDTSGTWLWDVWSTVNNSATRVTDGWVDNAFDIQRRRGRKTTTRTTFT